ncbi:hypothetical protein GCM10011428_47250 [Streptomyces violaceus]
MLQGGQGGRLRDGREVVRQPDELDGVHDGRVRGEVAEAQAPAPNAFDIVRETTRFGRPSSSGSSESPWLNSMYASSTTTIDGFAVCAASYSARTVSGGTALPVGCWGW